MANDQEHPHPHVLMLPIPLQSPISCMLKLAELFCLANFHVTFLNIDHFHTRLLRYTDVEARFHRYPTFHFHTVSDGLPEHHPRSGDLFVEMMDAMEGVVQPLLRKMLSATSTSFETPVTCIVAEAIIGFANDVAQEIGVPLLYFDTISPCAVWTYLNLPKLIQHGEVPFKDSNLDAKVTCIPGMESFLRRRDLPDFCRVDNVMHPLLQLPLKEAQQIRRARGIILNTFEQLDNSILSQIRTLCPNLYVIGPLHLHHKYRTDPDFKGSDLIQPTKTRTPNKASVPTSSNCLWEEDRSCIAWLDRQPVNSVVYVSTGSQVSMQRDEFIEFLHGLVNSRTRFLWVVRPGSVDDDEIPAQLLEGTRKMGCIVSWAPQEEVLAHSSIGAFLTHSGWGSTLESIVEGVPMVCWPHYVDQQVISRYVSEVWKIGIDMKDSCERDIITKMVRDVMGVKREEFVQRAKELSKSARESVSEGGMSFASLDVLIEDIRQMSLAT